MLSVNNVSGQIEPSGNPERNFQNFANLGHPGKFFCQMSGSWASVGACINKFYIFLPFSRSQSLEYLQIRMENIAYLYQLKICDSRNNWIKFSSDISVSSLGQMPRSRPCEGGGGRWGGGGGEGGDAWNWL